MEDQHNERTDPTTVDGPFQSNPETITITQAEYSQLFAAYEWWQKVDQDTLELGRIFKEACGLNLPVHHFPLATQQHNRFMVGGFSASNLPSAFKKYRNAFGMEQKRRVDE